VPLIVVVTPPPQLTIWHWRFLHGGAASCAPSVTMIGFSSPMVTSSTFPSPPVPPSSKPTVPLPPHASTVVTAKKKKPEAFIAASLRRC